ncbi:alpha/beta-hydrolase [Irpex rosettiformis]|uniref:Alpha/beta-hydrolase n=1 Tax=Irpex rosettiformis TaxID=378272 RepID=A0ACB8TMF2_9APHY|nr:alpha/beta-hydrolase [Irpex rosettiformis]
MPKLSNIRQTVPHFSPSSVQTMLSLVASAPLPPHPPILTSNSSPSAPDKWSLGIEYDFLHALRKKWVEEWKWERVAERVEGMDHFLVDYEDDDDDEVEEKYEMTLHFVHQRSSREDAIPLLILHGWPGTFFDFHKIINPLVNPPSPDLPAFHVVAPSLPGYFLSTLPQRSGFDLPRIAKLFNALMVDGLGYNTYVAQGGDWGAMTLRIISSLYPTTCLAPHFTMFRAVVTSAQNPAKLTKTDLSQFTESERAVLTRREEFAESGFGYHLLHQTKPFTIGLALSTSPLALLTYVAEKFYTWSDPERLDPTDILDTVALYWLSGCFSTSVMMYNQTRKQRAEVNLPAEDGYWPIKTKTFGFSSFPYEIGGTPRKPLEAYGNLTFYKAHTHGGHFPALDNPEEFVDDLREYFASSLS